MGLVGGVRSVPALILWDKAARTSVLYEGDVNNAQVGGSRNRRVFHFFLFAPDTWNSCEEYLKVFTVR